MDNTVELKEGTLEINGAGGLETKVSDFESLELVTALPELGGTGGFSLGLVKKGNFIRTSDQAMVRVIKNDDQQFIHYTTSTMDVYFSLSNKEQTLKLFQELSEEYLETVSGEQ